MFLKRRSILRLLLSFRNSNVRVVYNFQSSRIYVFFVVIVVVLILFESMLFMKYFCKIFCNFWNTEFDQSLIWQKKRKKKEFCRSFLLKNSSEINSIDLENLTFYNTCSWHFITNAELFCRWKPAKNLSNRE